MTDSTERAHKIAQQVAKELGESQSGISNGCERAKRAHIRLDGYDKWRLGVYTGAVLMVLSGAITAIALAASSGSESNELKHHAEEIAEVKVVQVKLGDKVDDALERQAELRTEVEVVKTQVIHNADEIKETKEIAKDNGKKLDRLLRR